MPFQGNHKASDHCQGNGSPCDAAVAAALDTATVAKPLPVMEYASDNLKCHLAEQDFQYHDPPANCQQCIFPPRAPSAPVAEGVCTSRILCLLHPALLPQMMLVMVHVTYKYCMPDGHEWPQHTSCAQIIFASSPTDAGLLNVPNSNLDLNSRQHGRQEG